MNLLGGGGSTLPQRLVAFAVAWAIVAVAVWAAAYFVEGIHLEGWESIAIVSLIIGLLNALLFPILSTLAFPIRLMTLGLFSLILGVALNAGLLWVADRIAEENPRLLFSVDAFIWDAVLGGLIISLVSWVLNMVINPRSVARRMR